MADHKSSQVIPLKRGTCEDAYWADGGMTGSLQNTHSLTIQQHIVPILEDGQCNKVAFPHQKRRNAASGCQNGHSLLNRFKLTVFHKPFLFLALILTFHKKGDINYGSVLF